MSPASPSRPRALALALSVLLIAAALAGCSVPTSTIVTDPEAPPVFAQKWGNLGPGPGQFTVATGVAVDSAGNVYVTDSANHRVQKFTSGGVFLLQWGTFGTANGQMKYPTAVAVDAAGVVYVSDSMNYRVQKFTPTGAYLGQWGSYGTGDGQFRMARGIAVDSLGHVFVSDAKNHNVQKFTLAGVFINKWGGFGGGDGQMNFPRGLAVDSAGYVYVADFANDRVQKFDNAGAFVQKWGGHGSAAGEFNKPYGVAVDALGGVYVTDVHNHRVQKFTWYGGLLAEWGGSGVASGEFDEPYGIAVDASKNVYVVDGANNRIQKFRYVVDSIDVNVLVDGVPWSGPVSFTIAGPQTFTGATAPYFTSPAAPGGYTVTGFTGGPPGAFLMPSSSVGPKLLNVGGAIAFTLNFSRPTNLEVRATLDGNPWSGPLGTSLSGLLSGSLYWLSTMATYAGSTAPQTFANVSQASPLYSGLDPMTGTAVHGTPYWANYQSGGPVGATLATVTPAGFQLVEPHHTGVFTFNFRSAGLGPNSIVVNATLDGAPWSGPLNYQIGMFSFPTSPGTTFVGSVVPHAFQGLPQTSFVLTDPVTGVTAPGASYILQYFSGGPPGATLASTTPNFYVVLHQNGSKTFTLNFVSPPVTTGTVTVDAMLDGAPWTGPVGYVLTGPQVVTGSSASQVHAGLQPGTYAIGSVTGGPPNAGLTTISPALSQTVAAGGTTGFTLHFRTKQVETGTILVKAFAAGAGGAVPWSGPLNFTLAGPTPHAGPSVPHNWNNALVGTYTLTYVSGGPPGLTLHSITPSPTGTLAAGGTVTYTLHFR